MSSIGPQLPSHLQSPSKRKSPTSPSPSPPSKRVANANEIDINESSSDDGYGPKAPAPAPAPTTSTNNDEIDLSGSEDDMGPALPPAPQPQAQPQPKPEAHQEEEDDASSSEDDYGPSLPTASTRAPIGPSLPPSTSTTDEAPKRDDWMLAPPPSSGPSTNPSKITNRNFSSKPSSGNPSGKDGTSSIWTETPQEKLERLQNAVLGRSEPSSSSSLPHSNSNTRTKEDKVKERKVKENFEASRGKSMVEEAKERRKKGGNDRDAEGDDDPSKRAFDREKDMAIGGRFGGKERREMMESAKDQSRFSKGTFL